MEGEIRFPLILNNKTKPTIPQGKKSSISTTATARAPRRRATMAGGLLTWRLGAAPSFHKETKQLTRARRNGATFRPSVMEARLVWAQIPASLAARPSLNNWFEAEGSFTTQAYMFLDAGNPKAQCFFSTLDFKEVHHAVLGMLLSWLHFEFPRQYPLSVARWHQGQSIAELRRRLGRNQYDDETYVIMFCAMQADSLKTRLDFFVLEALESPSSRPSIGVDYDRHSKPLTYPTPPYTAHVEEAVSRFPPGLQDMARQPHGMSLEVIKWWDALLRWMAHVSITPYAEQYDIYPDYDEVGWLILKRLDGRTAPHERASCIAVSLHMAGIWYRRMVYSSIVFRTLRAQGTRLVAACEPTTAAERDWWIFHGLKIYTYWKTETAGMDEAGLRLLAGLKAKFDEVACWDTLLPVLQKFPAFGPDLSEWEHLWLEGINSLAEHGSLPLR
ncbi:hypothetical protein LTR84_008596 [Exophiala bonariae]|uniref:Uncharacterized protein n=1 Tax=Exophiala bonariae TaxID=1690606 RepID=A0AAV9MX26_9EURO|nr:hypothetical protein LTR84_008596 [Exophiala bonariae]